MNGVMTVIGAITGKCIDYVYVQNNVLLVFRGNHEKTASRSCRLLSYLHRTVKLTMRVFSGSMEISSLVECFSESVANRQLRYIHNIGDDDTKSYSEVVKNDPCQFFKYMRIFKSCPQ